MLDEEVRRIAEESKMIVGWYAFSPRQIDKLL